MIKRIQLKFPYQQVSMVMLKKALQQLEGLVAVLRPTTLDEKEAQMVNQRALDLAEADGDLGGGNVVVATRQQVATCYYLTHWRDSLSWNEDRAIIRSAIISFFGRHSIASQQDIVEHFQREAPRALDTLSYCDLRCALSEFTEVRGDRYCFLGAVVKDLEDD